MSETSGQRETESIQPASDPRRIAEQFAEQYREPQPTQIGPYRILQMLGEGAFGVVYLAEQDKPVHRRVALKIIKPGMDTKQVIARFEAEREALALMNHPNVAKVFDAGVTERGRPYFVMEYVPGIPITEYCDKQRLNTKERLGLFMDVCHAVQHAHQKGIIHRDIKPGNVLVMVDPTVPAACGPPPLDKGGLGGVQVKIIDFGVAKATQHRLTERTVFTEQGQLIGTPGYMSPEQAEMTALDIDTRTDIYSLGVLLYELLVGARPFDDELLRQAGFAEIQRVIRDVDPPKPSTKLSGLRSGPGTPATGPLPPGSKPTSLIEEIAKVRHTEPATLIRQIRGDLDWIVMKCLEKDRTRRYDTATGLAMDIDRYLRHEPVLAGPPSAAYRFRKFVRRNWRAVVAGGAVGLALSGGMVSTLVMFHRAEKSRADAVAARDEAAQERDVAEQERDRAKLVAQFVSEILTGAGPAKALGRDTTMLREMLDAAATRIGSGELGASLPVELELRRTIGHTYRELGEYTSALKTMEPVPKLVEAIYGEDPIQRAAGLNDLALVLEKLGRFEEAEGLYREALGLERTVHGNEHPDVQRLMSNVAYILTRRGKLAEAERLLREVLVAARKAQDTEPGTLARYIENLAFVADLKGRYGEAEALYRESMSLLTEAHGKKYPDTARAMARLGYALVMLQRWEEGEALLAEALEIQRTVLGEEHPDVAATLDWLGLALDGKGAKIEAERHLRDALAMRRRLLGAEHPDVATSLRDLAVHLTRRGELDEAQQLLAEAIELFRRLHGVDHNWVARGINDLGVLHFRREDFAEAARCFEEAARLYRKGSTGLEQEAAAALDNVGLALAYEGDHAGAERRFREALAIYVTVSGGDNLHVARVLSRIGTQCNFQGRHSEAEEAYRRALAIYEKVHGPSHQDTVQTRQNLGNTLVYQRRFAEAEEQHQMVLRSRREQLGEEHYMVADVLSSLANARAGLGNCAEAEANARAALAVYERTRPSDERRRALGLRSLGRAIACSGRFMEAEPPLLDAWRVLGEQESFSPVERRLLGEELVKLYVRWDATEPGKGYDEKAAEYRALLEANEAHIEGSAPVP